MAFPENATFDKTNLYQAERFPPSTSQVLVAGTTIAPNGNVIPVSAGSAITLTSTPTITAGMDGQEITVVNVGSFAITFQDKNVLAATTLLLARRSTLTLLASQAAKFLYSSTLGAWVEIKSTGFSGCRVYKSSAQTITNNTDTAVLFDSERFDTDNYHSIVSATTKLTPPLNGYYLVGGAGTFAGSAGGGRRVAQMRKNGSTSLGRTMAHNNASVAYMNPHTVDYFLTTDYLEFVVYQDSGGDLSLQSTAEESPEAWMVLLGS